MTPKQTLFLVVLGAVALGGGWYATRLAEPEQTEMAAGGLMFPNLAPALQGAERIEITSKGKSMAIIRQGNAWGLADRGGYPVQASKLREMLTGLTELRIMEPRTSDPAQFARLGLDDPDKPDGTGTLLRVLDGAGQPIAEIITGHRRMRTRGNLPESIYVRRPSEDRSYLAEGRLEVDADPSLWFDRDMMNIANSRIASVTVTRGDNVLEFGRADGKFVLLQPADAGAPDAFKLEEVSRGLETLTFTDVKEAKDTPGEKIGTGHYVTTDGLSVTATLFRSGSEVWARFDVSGTGAAKQEAARLQTRLHGWAYQVGAWKEKELTPALADLKATPPAPPPQTAPAPNVPPSDTPATPPAAR